jgi:hypothetical protein
MSSIVARQHRIHVGQSPFAHNFLVLLDDDGNRASELHGLPVNAKGEVLDKGRSSEWLRAFEDLAREKPKPRLDHAAEQVLWQGPHDEALARWQAAQKAHDQINSRNLSYSPLGGDFETPREPDAPRRPVIAGNSNSVFSTFVDAMGLPQARLPIMAPGTENPLLQKDELSPPQIKDGLLSPDLPKAGLLSPYRPNDGLPMQHRRGLLGPI